MEIKNRKIIVTGGAGFIGSNLVERLCNDNEVYVIDNLHTGSMLNLSLAVKSGNVKFKEADCGSISKIDFDAELVYHLGMYSSSPMYKKKPGLLGEVAREMIEVLEYVRVHKIPLVFASTSSIYSGITPPHREDANYNVTDYYTEGRIFDERASELYNRLYGCDIAAMRFFSVYGRHEEAKKNYANLITQFMWLMQKGESPVIYGDGQQKRDFIFVDDVVDALLMASKIKGFEIMNVGTGKSYTLNQIVDKLNGELGTKIKPKRIKMPVSNYVMETLADTSKAKKLIGFEAHTSIDEGISMLLKGE